MKIPVCVFISSDIDVSDKCMPRKCGWLTCICTDGLGVPCEGTFSPLHPLRTAMWNTHGVLDQEQTERGAVAAAVINFTNTPAGWV